MSLKIKKEIQFILGGSSKLKAAFYFYSGFATVVSRKSRWIWVVFEQWGCGRAKGFTWHVQSEGSTLVALGHGGPEPNPGSELPSFRETLLRSRTWVMSVMDQMDPERGSRPSSWNEEFYLQRISVKHDWQDLLLVAFWICVWGFLWVFFILFYFSRVTFLHLLPTMAQQAGTGFYCTSLRGLDVVIFCFPLTLTTQSLWGCRTHSLFPFFPPLFTTEELFPDLMWRLVMRLLKKKNV